MWPWAKSVMIELKRGKLKNSFNKKIILWVLRHVLGIHEYIDLRFRD